MSWAIQDIELPVRLRPRAPMTDDERMAFSEADKPCKVERLATGEILVTRSGRARRFCGNRHWLRESNQSKPVTEPASRAALRSQCCG